jgi:hypothetical protein
MDGKQYSVQEILELATALKVAAEKMLADGRETIQADEGWQALAKVLAKHPEVKEIGPWMAHCLKGLTGSKGGYTAVLIPADNIRGGHDEAQE